MTTRLSICVYRSRQHRTWLHSSSRWWMDWDYHVYLPHMFDSHDAKIPPSPAIWFGQSHKVILFLPSTAYRLPSTACSPGAMGHSTTTKRARATAEYRTKGNSGDFYQVDQCVWGGSGLKSSREVRLEWTQEFKWCDVQAKMKVNRGETQQETQRKEMKNEKLARKEKKKAEDLTALINAGIGKSLGMWQQGTTRLNNQQPTTHFDQFYLFTEVFRRYPSLIHHSSTTHPPLDRRQWKLHSRYLFIHHFAKKVQLHTRQGHTQHQMDR